MNTDNRFTLTDTDLALRFYFHPFGTRHNLTNEIIIHSFAPFKYPELIKAIYDLNYRKAYRLLNELTELLSPEEAVAACLCAVFGSDRLLNAVLDHCPPIPEFQFKGVGRVSDLIAVVVKYDFDQKLRILLRRGADPNRGCGSTYPLEIAFANNSHASLWELLQAPGLNIELTETILNTWGQLSVSPDANENALFFQWCCQLMCEKMDPEDFPFRGFTCNFIPPQLRPRHALAHNNQLLAARICDTNPMTDEDIADLRTHFDGHIPLPTNQYAPISTEGKWVSYTTLLKAYIRHVPFDPDDPVLRRAIACAAAGTPTPDEEMLAYAAHLTDGPVQLKSSDVSHLSGENCLSFVYFLLETFISQWEERLGDRLSPAMDLSELTSELIDLWDSDVFLKEFTFIGGITEAQWDEFLPAILHKFRGDDQQTALLMQPGKILSHVPEDMLLAILPQLPIKQRAAILLHINKNSDFNL